MNSKIITAPGAAILLGLTFKVAHADTWVFRDTLMPNGHARSMKAKISDAHKCGAVGSAFSDAVLPMMQSCMWSHGWALDHVVPDPAPRYVHHRRPSQEVDSDEDLRKRNEDASNDAERQRDEEMRNDDAQRQLQDQINNDAAISALNAQ